MTSAVVKDGALLSTGELPPLKLLASGKVRDLFEVDADTLLVVSTDRISAFDVIMLNGVPDKGKILNQLTVFWLRRFEQLGLVAHHLITDDVAQMPPSCQAHAATIGGRAMLVKRLKMLPVEAVIRGYITGSGWADYTRTGAVCGITLPTGLRRCDRLPAALYTPSTKAELGEHDANITAAEAAEAVGATHAEPVEKAALQLYASVSAFAEERGIIVADTKMEFGLDASGTLTLGDECFTPDCSRYWPKEGYAPGKEQDSFDKQCAPPRAERRAPPATRRAPTAPPRRRYVRNYLTSVNFDKQTPLALPADVVERTLAKYVQIFEILTGGKPNL